jgi:hypothetical protein
MYGSRAHIIFFAIRKQYDTYSSASEKGFAEKHGPQNLPECELAKCALSVNLGFFALGFADFAIWPLGVIKFLPVMEYKPVRGRSCGRHDR